MQRFENFSGASAYQLFVQFADQHGFERFVVAAAQLAQRAWRANHDEMLDFMCCDLLVEPSRHSGGMTVFLKLVTWIGGTGLMPAPGILVVSVELGRIHRREFRCGLIAGIAKEFELFAVNDSDDSPVRQQHVHLQETLRALPTPSGPAKLLVKPRVLATPAEFAVRPIAWVHVLSHPSEPLNDCSLNSMKL